LGFRHLLFLTKILYEIIKNFLTFEAQNEANHNKDYSVVKTSKAVLSNRLFILPSSPLLQTPQRLAVRGGG
jgi:hypothetical protein